MNVIIIGGGASGMMAAITASSNNNHVTIFERQNRVGRKLMATGNGRCNLSNINVKVEHYHGCSNNFCRYALEHFDVDTTIHFFNSIGLLTVIEENGKVYPETDNANSVVDVLRLKLEMDPNVEIITSTEIRDIKKCKNVFVVSNDIKKYYADALIVCCGGIAGEKLGGTTLGYELLENFGHKRSKLYPSLVQIKTDNTYVKALKGIRVHALVKTCDVTNVGELQFTEYGLSGPVIFEISRYISFRPHGELVIDLLPNHRFNDILEALINRISEMPELLCENLLTGFVHNRIGRTILKLCGIALETRCGNLTVKDVKKIVSILKNWKLETQGVLGFDNAQVTAGGILTADFDSKSMESRLCKHLYAAGEVLDIDGDCGGYNLQWAWSSGHLAGELRGNND